MKMQYVTVKSGLETLEGAYTGQFVSNGTMFLDDISAKMCEGRPAVDEPEARLAIRAIAAEIRKRVGEDFSRVNMGDIIFEPAISGSVPAMDSPLSNENRLYVNIIASDAIKKAVGAIVPTRDSSSAVKVQIDSVADMTAKMRQIVGTHEFVMTGLNLSASLDGEDLVLLKDDGSVASAVTVSEVDGMGQRIYAHLAVAVPAGNYLLQLTTHGYSTPDAEVESYTKRVVVTGSEPTPPEPADAPTATSWVADGMEGEPIDLESSSVTVSGTKLAGATKVQFMYSEDGAVFDSADVGEATDTSVTAQCGFTGTPTQSEGFLRVVTPNGTTNSIPCTFRR